MSTPFFTRRNLPSMPSQTSQTSLTDTAQKLDRLVRLETSQTRHTLNLEESTVSLDPKTSFKTIENFDDEAFAGFTEVMKQSVREVTGKEPAKIECDRWRELAELLSVELKIAAARTSVSSVPSFLTEHLRRRLWKTDKKLNDMSAGKPATTEISAPLRGLSDNCPDCGGTGFYYPVGYESGVAKCMHAKRVSENAYEKRLTPFEITEQSGIIKDLLENGYPVSSERAVRGQLPRKIGKKSWGA